MSDIINIRINGILIRVFIWLIPVFLICCFYFLQKVDYPTYSAVVSEDNIVEYMTSLLYLISSIIALRIFISFLRNKNVLYGVMYLILSIGLFLVFGDEISWGQRIFGLEIPALFSDNRQGEINIHNLGLFKSSLRWFYISVGFYGSLLWLITRPLKRKFSLILTPYFIPKWYLMSFFLPASLYYLYLYYILPFNNFAKLSWRDQEPVELILSMGFLSFVIINRIRQIQDLGLNESKIITVSSNSKDATDN